MSAEDRKIIPFIERDDISWWAGCEYADKGRYEIYIRKTPCMTRWGAEWTARRLAKKARRLRDKRLADYYKQYVGPAE